MEVRDLHISRAEDIADPDDRQRFHDLCHACRVGDLEQVATLVSLGVPLNALDRFDTSPLILASLCGHQAVVEHLLHHGAICDRDTFQGERCLYGALTERIRQTLLQFDISKAVDDDQPFAAHLAAVLPPTTAPVRTHDVVLRTTEESGAADDSSNDVTRDTAARFELHRFVLSARSTFFARHLAGPWARDRAVALSGALDPAAFHFVVRYLYLFDQPFPRHPQLVQAIRRTAQTLDLGELVADIDEMQRLDDGPPAVRIRARRALRQALMHRARAQFQAFVENWVVGQAVELEASDADLSESQRAHLRNVAISADVILEVLLADGSIIYYPAHKTMLIRAEYFLTMFTSAFAEAQTGPDDDELSVLQLPVTSKAVAELVLMFLYTDRIDIPLSLAVDVLHAADVLLLDRLKSMAAIVLTKATVTELRPHGLTVYDVLRAGWSLRLDRLERYAAKTIADGFYNYIDDPEFHKIVVESSGRIRDRQETDTIELVDDIRFYLAKNQGIIFEDDRNIITNRSKPAAEPVPETRALRKVGKIKDDAWTTKHERDYNAMLDRLDDLLEDLRLDA